MTQFSTIHINFITKLKKKLVLTISIFLMDWQFGECSSISSIDSTPLKVCAPHRIYFYKHSLISQHVQKLPLSFSVKSKKISVIICVLRRFC